MLLIHAQFSIVHFQRHKTSAHRDLVRTMESARTLVMAPSVNVTSDLVETFVKTVIFYLIIEIFHFCTLIVL